jgi:hypothetical protein
MSNQVNHELFKLQDGKRFAFDPEKQEYVPVNDVTEKMKEDTEKHPPSNEAKKAFYQQRIKLVESSNLANEHKNELLQGLNHSVEVVESASEPVVLPDPPPKPGGVGFGVYYKPNTLTFDNSSALHYRIVTVPGIGAELNEWLYLTSTNYTPKGTEAFISYHQQDNPTFAVFDWSKPEGKQWGLSKPYSELGNYLTIYRADNHQYPTISVINSTRRLDETRWINEVMLRNKVTKDFDLVYRNEYDLPEADEDKRLDWGPIVETFSPFPNETNRIGFFNAMLLQDGKQHMLTQKLTDLRIDDEGFEVVYFRPNSSFIVH